MILVRLMGGLGNQMFQYAYGRALSARYHSELVLDDSFLTDRSSPHEIVTHREFALSVFPDLKYRMATTEEVVRFNGVMNADIMNRIRYRWRKWTGNAKLLVQKGNEWTSSFESPGDNICVVGRFQSEFFFRSISGTIRGDFSRINGLPPEAEFFGQELSEQNTLAVHVRRGDLVSSPLYSRQIGALDLSYYQRALALIQEKAIVDRILVFSDEPEWCRQNLGIRDAEFASDHLSGPYGVGHLFLMSKCRHQIISNSTFAWWAGWLNQHRNKVVVGPESWYMSSDLQNSFIFPNAWFSV